jgi:anti-anti-sigma factor
MRAMPSVDDGRTEFSVRTRQDAAVRVIDVRGEIDLGSASALQPDFETALAAEGPVVLDLCAATFLDSTGLYSLLVFRENLREQSRPLAVACWPSGAVAMALRVSGTDRVFQLHASRDGAIAGALQSTDTIGSVRRAAEGVLSEAIRRLRSLR